MSNLTYLQDCPERLLSQVRTLINKQRLGDVLAGRYPGTYDYVINEALQQYIQDLENQSLRNTPSIDKVMYDNKIHVLKNALGLHTVVSRVQGDKLRAKVEICVTTVSRNAPELLLCMIVVHELAHSKEEEHNKAFYRLCCHMEPRYYQLELDTRLQLTQLLSRQNGI